MNCMKCGKETSGDYDVFCQDCLDKMEAYPVKPGTPVHIPAQPQHAPLRKPHRKIRNVDPEEQIRRLKQSIKRLVICLILLLAAWGVTIAIAVHQLQGQDEPPLGQNFGASTSSTSTDTSPAPNARR